MTGYNVAPDDPDVPGLAGERTDLAWNRTMLAATVLVATLLKRVWEVFDRVTARVAVYSIIVVGALGWFGAMRWAWRVSSTTLAGRARADHRALFKMTLGTVAFALVALALSLVPS